jgi:hypothetical protein
MSSALSFSWEMSNVWIECGPKEGNEGNQDRTLDLS